MFKSTTRLSALCLLLALAGGAQAQLIPPGQRVAGQSQEEWSKRWWHWALSFEEDDSPVSDSDGRLCARGQSGPVWFLAGSYGSQRTVRRCSLPAGKTLFFPLVNVIAFPPDEAAARALLKRQGANSRITRIIYGVHAFVTSLSVVFLQP